MAGFFVNSIKCRILTAQAGLTMIQGKLDLVLFDPTNHPLVVFQIFIPDLIFLGLILVGLFTSLIADFPRWGYSYLAWTHIVGLF